MKVTNMTSSNGNKVPNQFIIEDDNGTIFFQSYNTVIAKKQDGRIYLDIDNYNYSKTTSKYLYKFLNMDSKQVHANIIHGVFIMSKLNYH